MCDFRYMMTIENGKNNFNHALIISHLKRKMNMQLVFSCPNKIRYTSQQQKLLKTENYSVLRQEA